jgi:outer membrane receptor protein involved in Fe transport
MQNQYVPAGETDNLSGNHNFARLNPPRGLTYQILKNLGVYGSYSESARAPSPMELSCSNPENPCKLPNAFLSDPPLQQVVAKTFEGGITGNLNNLWSKTKNWQWNLGYFHTINNNDIIFQHAGNLNGQGYFTNVGNTRRYGVAAGTSTMRLIPRPNNRDTGCLMRPPNIGSISILQFLASLIMFLIIITTPLECMAMPLWH